MKNLCKLALLAIIAASLAAVSCTSDLKADIDKIEEKINATQTSLQQQITAMRAALENYEDEVAPKLEALVAEDEALHLALTNAYGDLETALASKVSEEAFQQAVTAFQNALADLIADQKEIDDAQSLALQVLSTRVENYKSDLETALDTRIAALDAAIGANIQDLDTRIKANKAAIDKLNNETIPALKGRIATCEDNIAEIQADLEAFEGATADNIASLQAICDGLADTKLNKATYNSFVASFNSWKNGVNTHLSDLDEDLGKLSGIVDILEKELAILKSDGNPGYITLQAYVEGIRNALQAQIDLLSGADINFDEAIALLNEKIQEKLSALEAEIATLKARVQSLVFVPQYTDLKFGIPFSKLTESTEAHSVAIAYNDPENFFEVVYKVSPDSLAPSLAEHASEVFTFVIEDGLKTRAPMLLEPKLTIKEAEGDAETGKIAFKLYHENFEARIEGGEPVIDNYAISLVVADESKGIHVASEYTGTVNIPSPTITVDMSNLYIHKEDAEVETKNVVAYTKTTNEYTNEIQYIDSTLRTPYKGCFLAAKITPVKPLIGVPAVIPHYTYDQLRELGYNMPASSLEITTTASDDKCAFLKHADLANAEFATVNIDSTKALKLVKEHLIGTSDVHSKKLNYAYADGFGGILDMSAVITLGKANKLNFEITHDMKWTYEIDKLADHENIGIFKTNWEHNNLLSVPVLVRDTMKVALDGSDKAYGIVASDFYGKAFTKGANAVKPDQLAVYDYTVMTPNTEPEDNTIVLKSAAISSWGILDAESKVCKATYDLAGSYVLPFSKVSNALVTINATDRDRTPIDLVLEPFDVTLLGGESLTEGGRYVSGSQERYLIKSANLASDVYGKYVAQKIFSADKYTQKNAFGLAEDSEFNDVNVVWNNVSNENAARFGKVFTNNTQGGSFYLQSNDLLLGAPYDASKHLTSEALRDLSQNYDGEGNYLVAPDTAKFVTYSFYSYIGQVVNVNWPILAKPAATYMFTTYGALENEGNYYFNISPSTVWYNPDYITRANTELDLIINSNIQIVTGTNGEGGISPVNFADKGLVPEFRLAKEPAHVGVSIDDKGSFLSNVKYYGQVDSVAVKSALYVKSADIRFYVPGSEHMYVNYSDKKVDSVFVRKFNPIAEPDRQVLTGNAVINAGSAGVLPLNMVDINGNYIYKNGYAQSNKGKYHETIKNIFNDIVFKLVSVDGSEEFTGWSLVSGNTPDALKLNVPAGIAEAAYTVVVEAHSSWKDYTYTLTIRNGNVSGGIDAGNQDYGNGGSQIWK